MSPALSQEKITLAVFTYAPAGFGHIRVADALMESTPASYRQATFSPSDLSIESIHRLMSLNPMARNFTQWVQQGAPQRIFTRFYRKYLRQKAENFLLEFISLIKSQEVKPDKVVIISTHFGLAHQLGEIKKKLENILSIEIKLVVQVTDDSPQYIWYVDSADLIIVPSIGTKRALEKYALEEHLYKTNIQVAPYPILADFARTLSPKNQTIRGLQYDPEHNSPIHVVIPVSGAAVGMKFFLHLMLWLNARSERFVFHVVCRKAPFTEEFIKSISNKEYVSLYVTESYAEMVRMYNMVYANNVISAEITKPSEQAFKALLKNTSMGGSFIFFASPVGRQEMDNLNFLRKHNFISLSSEHTRGLQLPVGSKSAADFIWKLYSNGTLLEKFNNFVQPQSNLELASNGAERFWEIVGEKFK